MSNSEANIRIAKNTIIVYIRIFVTIVVGLITSRLVLQALGVDDYGLYNVVGSVVAMFGFINGALSGTTQRFINFEMGKPDGNPGKMFNICNVLHIGCALVLLLLIETIGIIYIQNWLNVAPGKEGDAMFVFQVSTIVACVGIMNIPYQSLFLANEKFLDVAIIDIVLNLVKLGLVFLLLFYNGNALRLYAIFMSISTFASFIVYHLLCRKHWPEIVKWQPVKEATEYKEALSFNNWNLLSSAALLARSQGSNMLINFFFGTAVNAAYGIANTVLNYINKFIGNFDFAAAPQITQNLSAGDNTRSNYLTQTICRMSVLVMLIIYFTLMPELDFLLHLWLGDNTPDGVALFCSYTLLIGVVSSTSAGLSQLINAYGKVKWFKLSFAILYAAALIVGYFAYKNGAPAYTIILLFVIADALSRIVQLILLKVINGFDSVSFIKGAYIRPAIVAAIMLAYLLVYRLFGIESVVGKILGIVCSFALVSLLSFFIGLKSSEKERIAGIFFRKAKWTIHNWRYDHQHAKVVEEEWRAQGKEIDWDNPKDINEKIQWLLCFGDTSKWSDLADKIKVRDYIKAKGYDDILVPLLGTWDKPEDIDYEALPDKFVLKCNHDSGSTIIVDKSKGFDKTAINADLKKHLKKKFGYNNGELYYNKIKPRILAEKFLESKAGDSSIADYKVWCFDGKPYCIWACKNRSNEGVEVMTYTTDWTPRPETCVETEHYKIAKDGITKPVHLDRMLEIASDLSLGFPELRVDFYEVDGKLYFGEMTFASMGGRMEYLTPAFLIELGSQCNLSGI